MRPHIFIGLSLSLFLCFYSWSSFALEHNEQHIAQKDSTAASQLPKDESLTTTINHDKVVDNTVDANANASANEGAVTGQQVYEQHCSVCHRDGLVGAPRVQNEQDWKSHLSAGKTLNDLLSSAIKGVDAMPPKGTCSECTDDDLKNAIQYMLPKS